jgi:DNA methyltransferase 1-associated protein 1
MKSTSEALVASISSSSLALPRHAPTRYQLSSSNTRQLPSCATHPAPRSMTSRDVRDIMGVSSSAPPSSALQPPRRNGPPDPRQKRPDGITRELYALIGDNAPSLALAHAVKPKFKERIKRTAPSVKWQWTAFTNPSRGAGVPGDEGDKAREAKKKLKLNHWVRDLPANHVGGAPDMKFAKFNTNSGPYSYTTEEYNLFLRGEFYHLEMSVFSTADGVSAEDDWPREETDHLFALAHEYDLRFIVMADRWDYATARSVDVRPLSLCPSPSLTACTGPQVQVLQRLS